MPELQPEAIALAESVNGLVTAPAGCGKTQLITEAVHHAHSVGARRQLVLTHTHAGVDALRQRLTLAGVARSAYQVETIDGWALRMATAFPVRTGIGCIAGRPDDWPAIHRGVTALLQIGAIRDVIAASYGGVLVDEYQDCTTAQHDLVGGIGSIVPARVLGDPLQGIFDFAGAIDWDAQVATTFTEVGTLATPWRWAGKNERLGQWLIDQRGTFATGTSIDLSASPIHVRTPATDLRQAHWAACNALRQRDGSGIVIAKWEHTYLQVARTLQGTFSTIEPIDSKELLKHAATIAGSTGAARAAATIEMAKACATGVTDAVGAAAISKFVSGEIPNPSRFRTKKDMVKLLADVANDGSPASIHRALTGIRKADETKVFRRELLAELLRALAAHEGELSEASLTMAVEEARNRTRHTGRRLPPRAFGTPLLVKGLEFDHVVILKPEEMSRRELYVALSRATFTATVVSSSNTLTLTD